MKVNKFNQINEASRFEIYLDKVTSDMYKYTKEKCDAALSNQEESIKNFKSYLKEIKKSLATVLGKDFVDSISIAKYKGNQYHEESQKYMIEIHFPMNYKDKNGKEWYASTIIKDEIKSDKYKKYKINELDYYGTFGDTIVQLVMI